MSTAITALCGMLTGALTVMLACRARRTTYRPAPEHLVRLAQHLRMADRTDDLKKFRAEAEALGIIFLDTKEGA